MTTKHTNPLLQPVVQERKIGHNMALLERVGLLSPNGEMLAVNLNWGAHNTISIKKGWFNSGEVVESGKGTHTYSANVKLVLWGHQVPNIQEYPAGILLAEQFRVSTFASPVVELQHRLTGAMNRTLCLTVLKEFVMDGKQRYAVTAKIVVEADSNDLLDALRTLGCPNLPEKKKPEAKKPEAKKVDAKKPEAKKTSSDRWRNGSGGGNRWR